MEFPIFHLDFAGNRLLIAGIAILHVMINHALAVGAMPLVTLMEARGLRHARPDWDRLAYKTLAVCFVITTSVGALTGVGIWLATSLVNPAAIGSLTRVFFAAWFTEWIVFVLEVIAIMVYFLTWKSMARRKRSHVALGAALSVLSWLTMAIVVSILSFMMEPGTWVARRSFLSGIFNPLYLPQLAFRTPTAMVAAGLAALFLVYFLTRSQPRLRHDAVRLLSLWVLFWAPLALAGGWWYRAKVPGWMLANLPVALATQAYQRWYRDLATTLALMGGVVLLVAVWGLLRPWRVPRLAMVVPFCLVLVLLGSFERVREFIRKPFVIGDYMYANGIRADALPLLQADGVLAHATYVSSRTLSPDNHVAAGRDLFLICCTRCHTTSGVNSILKKLTALYGAGPWERDTLKAFFRTMHTVRPYMPPFPGSEEEAGALADYLLALRASPRELDGAQTAGVVVPPQDAASAPAGR
jgi:mono/diheme cytochrome c family protein